MTLTSTDPASPFLSAGKEVAEDKPPVPSDMSAEGMRRLRDPFAVDQAATRTTTDPGRPTG